MIVTSGGIGGNHDLVRAELARRGSARRRERMVSGVPAHVDGRMLGDHRGRRRPASSTPTGCGTTSRASATGTRSGPNHGIRILPGPSSLWLDATGKRLPAPLLPRLRHPRHAASTSCATGHDYSWFVLTQKIIEKEFALSGSEQNPDLTGKDIRLLLGRVRAGRARPGRGVQGARRGLRRRRHPRRAGRRDERARPASR